MLPDTILVATDFSEIGHHAADWAAELAKALGARLIVVHTYDIPVVGVPDGVFVVDATTAAKLSDRAQKSLDAEVARLCELGAGAEGLLRQGDPRDVIPKVVEDTRAGLVVMGSHGRRGLRHLLLGSVAETTVRTSSVPVVVVRKPV